MREDWYTHEIDASIDLNSAGIYEWIVDGIGVYVGKADQLRSRLGRYPNNVRNMLAGRPWHGNPNKIYRPVHEALRRAHDEGLKVTCRVLETCDVTKVKEREKKWIALRRNEAASGGPLVLNGRDGRKALMPR